MCKSISFVLLIASQVLMLSAAGQTASKNAEKKATANLTYIDPSIGNVGRLLEPTRPTVQLPNQLMRIYPLREDYMDDQISGFPLLVVSHRMGEAFVVKPTVAENLTKESWQQKMPYDHDLEITRPWYYSTYLVDDETTIEFVPGKKAGIFRFSFSPGAQRKTLLFNTVNNGPCSFEFISGTEVSAMETYNGDVNIYMYGRFNTAGEGGVVKDGLLTAGNNVAGNNFKSFISFPKKSPSVIEFKYAVSYISAEQARKNFTTELEGKTFPDIKKAGEAAWATPMNQVRVQGGTEAQKRSFYTALYRCYERMTDITEDGHYYSGYDKKIHSTTRPFYVDDWTWDSYLAHHPLRVILNPLQEEDMLNSYVAMYEQSGWMPTFPLLFGDNPCMNGFHSSIMFLDAYRKGLRNYDVTKAYEGMYKNATQATMLPWRNGAKTELDDFYLAKGFFPALWPGQPETNPAVQSFEKRQSVAVTLGGSYDDWAVAQLAKELGRKEDYQLFLPRANNYKNLWNSNAQFFMPKDSAGKWIDIDPVFDGGKGGRDYYDENNGWTYLWQVQQDIDGLVNLLGGKTGFENKLDQLFREPLGRSKADMWYKFPDNTGLVGQYSMGNEPSFHIPYLYNFTTSPWKTQKRVRFLLDTWFKDNIFGIPGDEDGGGMSAFVVFSAMGFYPITPGNPMYTIGSPLFEKVTIDLAAGKQFTMEAKNCSVINKYIQSATFDGKPLNTPWFTHAQLMNGGKLQLVMGPKPNKQWGLGK